MTRILVVDDDELVRSGLRLIIEQTDDLEVVAEAGDGDAAVVAARTFRPDVVLMDIRMPGVDGIEATRRITTSDDAPKVVVVTTFELDDYVFAALRAGASGFLLKRMPPETLIDGIRTVAAGEALLAPSVTRRLIDEFAARPERRSDERIAELTDRELEVLVAMARGLSNDEIAASFVISENTVKTHVKRVLAKLEARDRVHAVVRAYEAGLMDAAPDG